MDSEESYSASSSAATRPPTNLSQYISNLADLLTHFNEQCDALQSAYNRHDYSGDSRLCNLLAKIADMLAEVDTGQLFSKHRKIMAQFLSNFLTVNARQLGLQQDQRLPLAVAQVILVYSQQLKFVEQIGATKQIKLKILECGQAMCQDKALYNLKRAGRNLLRIH